MDTGAITVAALGRPFTIGMLYDANEDRLLPGFTLWDEKTLKGMIKVDEKRTSDSNYIFSDSLEEKCKVMDIGASLKASIMAGMFEVKGSAKYLNNQKKSRNQLQLTFQYKTTTNFKQLNLGPDQLKTKEIDEDIKRSATHVVTGIEYGTNFFFVFDLENSSTETIQETEAHFKAVMTKFPHYKIGLGADFQLSEKEKKVIENVSCSFYGDMILEKNSRNFEEALLAYSTLPELLGKNKEYGVPMKVWMMPLKTFDPSASEKKMEISVKLLKKAENVLQELNDLIIRCNDCLKGSYQLPLITEALSNFKQYCVSYRQKLICMFAEKFPKIRAGKEDENDLLKILDDKEMSPLSSFNLGKWMKSTEREVNVIKSCVEAMESVKVLSKDNEFDKELLSTEVEEVLNFVFTSLKSVDPYLQKMEDYICTMTCNATGKVSPCKDDPWYYSIPVIQDMQKKALVMGRLAKALKNEKKYRFFISATRNDEVKGATIYHYSHKQLITKDFQQPHLPAPEKIKERRDVLWYASEVTLDPDTAHPNLKVSSDHKKVEHGDQQWYKDNHQRFIEQPLIMCKEKLSGHCHYWEMEVNSNTSVDIGVCYGSLDRKGLIGFSSSWSLGWRGNTFYIQHDNKSQRKPCPSIGFSRIGVFLNCSCGCLTYYIVRDTKLDHIHTFRNTFSEPVFPCMKLGTKGSWLSLCM
ncbi:stonustoxin subunit alpha-like [Cyprinodon tularosa]|uniref:stonustoxin subunit alpha-like n=1 Tax=Cyprinodon tularosa TaxID=77115 RepID=UPI0018E1F9CF|nr:stonustoxin subunit alpha-like [Cyprinodon tularosa]